jgi:glucose/arabinose dehydrogenase
VAVLVLLQTAGPGTAPAANAAPLFSSEVFLSGLNFPVSPTFAPDGRMFFNERCGDVRIVDVNGQLLATPFADVGTVDCSDDHGLIGLAFDPDYATNKYVYVGYMLKVGTNPNTFQGFVERFTDVNNVGTQRTMIIDDLPTKTTPQHGLNNIHFGPDGKLYVSVGDAALHAQGVSQDLSTAFGKILRVNKEDGSAPADNPFVSTPGADPRIYAYGFRNSYDFAFHPANGGLYVTENGPASCDELNLVVAGDNYEWPEGFTSDWPGYPVADTCTPGIGNDAMYYHRFYEWMQGWNNNSTVAPVGITAIDGDLFPSLGDSLIICEFRNGVLRLLQLGGPALDQVIAEPRLVNTGPNSCLVDVELSPSGQIYYTTYNSIRRLFFDADGDLVEDALDNCLTTANADQADADGDGAGNACEVDDDNDLVYDTAEPACGGDPLDADSRPERVDGNFTGVDDDGDTQMDEALPAGSETHDCDGDGFPDTVETHIGTDSQDPCGNNGWPLDFVAGGFQPNTVNIQDLGSFVAPVRHINTSDGDPDFDQRWDIVPGSTVGEDINVADVGAMVTGAGGYPAMFESERAFARECPWAP